MKRPRLTIAALMIAVMYVAALVAAAVATYRNPSEVTAGVASAVVLASLCLAALLAVIRRGRARGTWAGMAVFGLGYIAFAWLAEGAPPPPTTSLIDRAWDSGMGPGTIVYRSTLDMGGGPPLPRGSVERPTARRIGHAPCALAIGIVGSVLGYVLAGRDSEGGS